MHARGAREELAILLPNTMSHSLHNGQHVLPEQGASQPGLFARLVALIGRLVELPMRRSVMDEVGGLSDQELADLGLTRADVPQRFDPPSAADRHQQRSGSLDSLNWGSAD